MPVRNSSLQKCLDICNLSAAICGDALQYVGNRMADANTCLVVANLLFQLIWIQREILGPACGEHSGQLSDPLDTLPVEVDALALGESPAESIRMEHENSPVITHVTPRSVAGA